MLKDLTIKVKYGIASACILWYIAVRIWIGPFYTLGFHDPSYSYLFNSFWLTMGRPPVMVDHPGLPIYYVLGGILKIFQLTPADIPQYAESILWVVWGAGMGIFIWGCALVLRLRYYGDVLLLILLSIFQIGFTFGSVGPENTALVLVPWSLYALYKKHWATGILAAAFLLLKWTFAPWTVLLLVMNHKRTVLLVFGISFLVFSYPMWSYLPLLPNYLWSWVHGHGYYEQVSYGIWERFNLNAWMAFGIVPVLLTFGVSRMPKWLLSLCILAWLPTTVLHAVRYAVAYAWVFIVVLVFFLTKYHKPWRKWEISLFLCICSFGLVQYAVEAQTARSGTLASVKALQSAQGPVALTLRSSNKLIAEYTGYYWSGCIFKEGVEWQPHVYFYYAGRGPYNGTSMRAKDAEYTLIELERIVDIRSLEDLPLKYHLQASGFVTKTEWLDSIGITPGLPIRPQSH